MIRRIRKLWISVTMGMRMVSPLFAERQVSSKGHMTAQVQNATRLERAPADEPVQLSLVVQLDENLLKQTLDQLYGSSAPSHKHFLSSSEFAEKFGLAQKPPKLKDFAHTNGLTIDPAEDLTEN